jgi:hypothetical protein
MNIIKHGPDGSIIEKYEIYDIRIDIDNKKAYAHISKYVFDSVGVPTAKDSVYVISDKEVQKVREVISEGVQILRNADGSMVLDELGNPVTVPYENKDQELYTENVTDFTELLSIKSGENTAVDEIIRFIFVKYQNEVLQDENYIIV